MVAPIRGTGIDLRSYLERGKECYRFNSTSQKLEVAHVPGAVDARFLSVPAETFAAVWKEPVQDEARRKAILTAACDVENWNLALRVVESVPGGDRFPLLQMVGECSKKERTLQTRFSDDSWPRARLDAMVRAAGLASWITKPDPSSGTGFINAAGMELVWCPPGDFLMGSPDNERDRRRDETQHRVTLEEGFWMGKFEITEAQWSEVMDIEIKFGSSQGAFMPKTGVTWGQCIEFCKKLTEMEKRKGLLPDGWAYQLPTEAQWEYACRAGTIDPFSFGKSLNGFGSKRRWN